MHGGGYVGRSHLRLGVHQILCAPDHVLLQPPRQRRVAAAAGTLHCIGHGLDAHHVEALRHLLLRKGAIAVRIRRLKLREAVAQVPAERTDTEQRHSECCAPAPAACEVRVKAVCAHVVA